MCGIAGIINTKNLKVNDNIISTVTDAAAHRGPDGRGVFIDNNVAIGHRRLSIIDLSNHANQPMQYGDDLFIVFNGEIYNYIEIKNELIKEGFYFSTKSDTEVILAAYKYWGKDCLNKFNGMWAFAIYDKAKQEVFCARDRFGVKPFYYATINNQFVFASEIKQLLVLMPNRKVNQQILADYLVTGFEEHKNTTFFESILKLPAAHFLLFDLKSNLYEIKKYYTIKTDSTISTLGIEDAVELYHNTFEDAVKLRMRSDVKVGTCLSGGVDSSVIAYYASKIYTGSNKFTAIHASSIDNNNDELPYAKTVSNSLNLDLQITKPTEASFIEVLNNLVTTQEEPFGSPSIAMQYFVMRMAKETGTTVLLDGQGGDETLLGYERYYPALIKSLPLVKKIAALKEISENSKLNLLQSVLYTMYFSNSSIRINQLKRKAAFYHKSFTSYVDYSPIIQLADSYNNIEQLQKLEIETTQLSHLLKYEDKNSMAHGIETRLPFLDYRCVETALSINIQHKINKGWTKYCLRKMADKKLPDSIIWRKNKIGFEAPTNVWLKNNEHIALQVKKSAILNKILKNVKIENLDNKQKWKLFNIALWENVFQVEV
jgi:asparagine synthase (glutamine-hydrolysing)